MGNRAVITASKLKDSGLGIYLHWNGGRASVLGFLKAARQLEITADNDEELMQQLGRMIARRNA